MGLLAFCFDLPPQVHQFWSFVDMESLQVQQDVGQDSRLAFSEEVLNEINVRLCNQTRGIKSLIDLAGC